jgi:hypothetical protein|tara:strand:+ start:4542 stop:4733 length:192 start_codon:yes stop_codon:yes gene_type:complete
LHAHTTTNDLIKKLKGFKTMGIGDIITEKKKDLDAWMKKQSTPVEVAAYSAGSAVQGAPTTDT